MDFVSVPCKLAVGCCGISDGLCLAGTSIVYGAMRSAYTMCGTDVLYGAMLPVYAMCGTDLVYGATLSVCAVYSTVLL
eukprot:976963-Rhodomonas_salina.1